MNKVISFDPKSIPTSQMHGYLLSAVAPRPIAFASTMDKQGNVNLSPFSFFNCFGANPPIMIFSPARRVRDNTTKHTLDNIREVPEVVINIVNYPIVEQMSLSSTEYDKEENEFIKAGLTQVESTKIHPPRVGESPVAFECLVDQVIETGQEGGAGNLVIARVIMVHVKDEYLDENKKLDIRKLDLVARMGGSWYCRASGDALFEIPKPIRTKGIGIDQLPLSVRNSDILTGNNLGRLGNIEELPDQIEIDKWANSSEISELISTNKEGNKSLKNILHEKAKIYLEQGETMAALKTLLVFDNIN